MYNVGLRIMDVQRRFTDNVSGSEEGGSVVIDSEKESEEGEKVNTSGCEEEVDVGGVSGFFEGDVVDDVEDFEGRETGLPKAAQAFLDAIKKNRLCQKYLRGKLMHIQSRIEENVKLGNRVKALKGIQFGCRRRTGLELSQKRDAFLQLIQATKVRVNAKGNAKSTRVMSYAPKENCHVANYKAMLEKFSDSMNRDKWSKQDDVNLAKGIKQQFQDMLLQKTYQNAERFSDSNEFDSIIESISDHDVTDENLREFLPKVNWEQLASMYTKGRSGAECEARWLNCADPLINKSSWTKSEEKKLLYIIQHKGISNWINIAASMGTNRTPFQCLAHYQRSLNPSIMKRDWTEDEDDKLCAAVAMYGESNWETIASSVLEGRTGTQCSNRWTKALHPKRKRKGKWIPDEDKRLKVAVMFFGAKNWRSVAKYVPERDHVQCRERWSNSLAPSVTLDKWSEEEDRRLEEAFEEYGPSWNKIASCVTKRTDNQCLRRWKILFPDEVPKLQMARKIKKLALPSNFVDREARRPAIGPSDFVHLRLSDSVPTAKNKKSCGKRKRKSRKLVSSADSYVSKLRSAKHIKVAQEICEGDEPPTREVQIASKKATGSRKKKTESSETISASWKVDTENRREASLCESESVDISNKEVGKLRGIDASKNRKKLKLSGKETKLTKLVNEAQVDTESDGVDCNEKSPSRSPERMLTDGDVAEPMVRDEERPLRCSTPEIIDSLNSRSSTVCGKRGRGKNSKPLRYVGFGDDMTVSPVSNQPRRSKRISSSECARSTEMVDASEIMVLLPSEVVKALLVNHDSCHFLYIFINRRMHAVGRQMQRSGSMKNKKWLQPQDSGLYGCNGGVQGPRFSKNVQKGGVTSGGENQSSLTSPSMSPNENIPGLFDL
ncbi:Myb-like protein L [Heracleum sosnowskyi]|uniref:Myb-like protein L n=1 Tax=Heracleum sosnowskyi TaxID=360622 RepID=A0AAD8I1T5_9APIA|nr:Myb-like protein L [Heracleum sosnowskyi]